MNWAALWTSIILIGVGAVITLATTVFTDLAKERRARRADRIARERDLVDRTREAGNAVARELFDILNEIWSLQISQQSTSDDEERLELGAKIEDHRRTFYRRYLLVPDPDLRQALQSGMYGFSNSFALTEVPDRRETTVHGEALEVLMVMRNAVASYLRRDSQNADDLAYLDRIRVHLNSEFEVDG
jgi:hypothetical protein